MSKLRLISRMRPVLARALMLGLLWPALPVTAQDIDFGALKEKVRDYTVVIDIKVEVSFGIHSSEQSERLLGTIVAEDGLVMFDGGSLASDAGLPMFSGFSVKTTPTRVDVSTLDGETYEGEYLGVDRFTRIGFLRIKADGASFTPIEFKRGIEFTVGDWPVSYTHLRAHET